MSELLERALRAHLTNGASLRTDVHLVAVALGRLLGQLESESVPLIGAAGFRAILARSIHVNRRAYPWFPTSPLAADEAPTTLERCFMQQSPAVAEDAAIALLLTIGQLLSTFIGRRLATELLKQAWPDVLWDGPAWES